LKQQELDDLALSLAVRNNWSPERIVEAKERVKVKKTALEVAFDKAKGREVLNQLFEEPRDNEKT
jgi:uncharacterized membrane protein